MFFNLKMSRVVSKKLYDKHKVTRLEVEECFYNRIRGLLEDIREEHKTNPPTLWFIAERNKGRLLKVLFIEKNQAYEIKTVYEPNPEEVKIYEKYA